MNTLIEYCLEEVSRHKKLSDVINISHLLTLLENSISHIRKVTMLVQISGIIVLVDSFTRSYNQRMSMEVKIDRRLIL